MKTIFLSVLAALLLIVPASASAAPEFSANVTSVDFVSPDDASGAFDPFDSETYEVSITIENTGDVDITSVEPSLASAPGESPYLLNPDPFGVGRGTCGAYNPGIEPMISHFLIRDSEGGICQFTVRFRPYEMAEGDYTETLKLRAFGMPGADRRQLVGDPAQRQCCEQQRCFGGPSSLDLGLVPADTTSTKTVTLTSTGTSRLLLSHLRDHAAGRLLPPSRRRFPFRSPTNASRLTPAIPATSRSPSLPRTS